MSDTTDNPAVALATAVESTTILAGMTTSDENDVSNNTNFYDKLAACLPPPDELNSTSEKLVENEKKEDLEPANNKVCFFHFDHVEGSRFMFF